MLTKRRFKRNLVGAWCPSITSVGNDVGAGTTYGLPQVWDISGNGNHAYAQVDRLDPQDFDPVRDRYSYRLGAIAGYYLNIPNFQSFAAEEGTVNVWVKPISTATGDFVWGRNASGNNAGDFYLYTVAGPKWEFVIQDGTNTSQCTWASNFGTTFWYMLTCTWAKGDEAALYVWGAKEADTDTAATEVLAHASVDLAWGSSGTGAATADEFNGYTDDLAIWDRRLGDDEIALLYRLGRGGWHERRKPAVAIIMQPDPLVTQYLVADLIATGDVAANLTLDKEKFVADITGSATVSANFTKAANRSVSQSLTFTQSAVPFAQTPGNTLELTDSATFNFVSTFAASNTLALTDAATGIIDILESPESELTLVQSVIVARVLPTETASNTLNLTQQAFGSHASSNVLVLTDVATGEVFFLPGVASSTLSLTDSVARELVTNLSVSSLLGVTHEATVNGVFTRSLTDALILRDSALAIPLDADIGCFVILEAPYDAVETAIILDCPLFGDTESLASTMSLRRSMNNRVQTYVKTNKRRKLNYTFRILNRSKAIELINFVKLHNTDEIKLLNWKGELWKVRPLTNPWDFVQSGRAHPGGDRTDISMEFEGVRING